MSRTVNPQRPKQLQDAILRYLIRHGLSDLSLRPLAKAVGSSPRMLLYYFGSKEKMLAIILGELRERQRASYERVQAANFVEGVQAVWKYMTAPGSEPLFRLFFEAYGIALRHPQQFQDFLRATVEDWLEPIADSLREQGYNRREARAFATVVLGGLRGFMLDYCNTHDRARLDQAVELWAGSLKSVIPKVERANQY